MAPKREEKAAVSGPADKAAVDKAAAGNAATDSAAADQPAPSLARRFFALMVDWMLAALLSLGFFADPRLNPLPAMLIFVTAYAFFAGLFGQTPGLWAARLRCVSVAGGRPIGVARAALRGLLRYLIVPVLIMDADRRGLHDRLVGSVIVRA